MNERHELPMTMPRILIVAGNQQARQASIQLLDTSAGFPSGPPVTEVSEGVDDLQAVAWERRYDICVCSNNEEACRTVTEAVDEDAPFALAFVDEGTLGQTHVESLPEVLRAIDPAISILVAFDPIRWAASGRGTRTSFPADVTYWPKPMDPLATQQMIRALVKKWLAEHHLRIMQDRVRQILSASPMVVYSLKAEGDPQLTYVSANVRECLGYDPEDFIGDTSFWIDRIHPQDRSQALQILRCATGQDAVSAEYRFRTHDGRYRWLSDQARLVHDSKGWPKDIVGCWTDVTERRDAEDRIRYLAYFDELTGLPNRALLRELLNHCITSAKRHDRRLAVLFLDIDHFKRINDSLGHDAGDELLREMGTRLSTCLRGSDALCRAQPETPPVGTSTAEWVSRLGGDEFVVVLNEIATPEDAAGTARRVARALSAPMTLLSDEVTVTSSIGISLFPDHGDTAGELLKNADAALYKAKDSGRNTVSFFTENLNHRTKRRLSLEARLRKALDHDEFVVFYQPIIDIRDYRVVGVEALIRWQQPDEGLISPAEFIPIAEETGLIVPIDKWVYHEACCQLQQWSSQGLPMIRVSVNVSAVQIHERTLVESIRQALNCSGLDPQRLQIELTETLLITNTDTSINMLNDLKALGTEICIDDFGTGYSSLSYLKKFPLNSLKVPRCFVRDLTTDLNDAAIVSATVALAHNMGLRTVAEGIETVEQLEMLRIQGSDEGQGYYFSKPLPPAALSSWLVDWHCRHPVDKTAAEPSLLAMSS